MRWAAAIAAMAVVLGLTGCGLMHKPAPQPSVVSTASAANVVIPEELTTAAWTRNTDTMEADLKILPDGRYRSVEIYSPVESGGIYQLRRVEDGVAKVSGNRLRLVGRAATVTRTAQDDPGGDYERTTTTRTGTYEWQITGDRLHLIDANGDDAIFTQTTN